MSPLDHTPEHNAEARRRAIESRHDRAKLLHEVASGDLGVEQVLDRGRYGNTDEVGQHARVAGRIKVVDLVLAVDGVGPVHAEQILEAAGIVDPEQRIDTLRAEERYALIDAVDQVG